MSDIAYLTPVAYWFGHPPALHLAQSSDTAARDRRMTRTPTLDGGAVIHDGGWSEADRTMTLVIRHLSATDTETLTTIAAYTEQHLALSHGLYRGRVKTHVMKGATESQIVFWVTAKLA